MPTAAQTRFQPAGDILYAKFAKEPDFIKPPRKGKSPRETSRALGRHYENCVQEHFEILSENYIRSPWIKFMSREDDKPRWCQPDGFFFDIKTGNIILVEIKYRHTPNAWWQLRELYEPILSHLFPPNYFTISLIEVVHWYDSRTFFPEKFYFAPDPLNPRPGEFGLHILAIRDCLRNN